MDITHPRAPDPPGDDRILFARVWSRVAAGPDCPVEAQGPSCPIPRPPAPAEGDAPPSPCPAVDDRAAGLLQDLTVRYLADAAACRRLARRSRRPGPLLSMAGQKVRAARRLSAACFLMTGVRYWPRDPAPVSLPRSFLSALRARFLDEQRLRTRLLELAGTAADPALRDLFQDLAGEARRLADSVRILVEGTD